MPSRLQPFNSNKNEGPFARYQTTTTSAESTAMVLRPGSAGRCRRRPLRVVPLEGSKKFIPRKIALYPRRHTTLSAWYRANTKRIQKHKSIQYDRKSHQSGVASVASYTRVFCDQRGRPGDRHDGRDTYRLMGV